VRVSRRHITSAVIRVLLLVPLALEMTGCKAQPAEWPELRQEGGKKRAVRIEAQTNREVADLHPDDVVSIARRIGFTDEQILNLGTNLHDALLVSGAAWILVGEEKEALLRIQGKYVLIYSASRGSFSYDLSRHDFGFTGSPAGR